MQSIALTSAFVLPLFVHDATLFIVAIIAVGTAYWLYHPVRRTAYADVRARIAHT